MTDYSQRLQIPVEGNETTEFKTKGGIVVGKGYTRIVIGERGPYLEFSPEQIRLTNCSIPEGEEKRQGEGFFYIEYRSNDFTKVKIYLQKKTVKYADYKVGMFYISPFDVLADDKVIIEKIERVKKPKPIPAPQNKVVRKEENDGQLNLFGGKI